MRKGREMGSGRGMGRDLVTVRQHEHEVHAGGLAGHEAQVGHVVQCGLCLGRQMHLHVVALLHSYARHFPTHLHEQATICTRGDVMELQRMRHGCFCSPKLLTLD